MTHEEHTAILSQIRESTDMAAVADLLGQLSTEHEKELAQLDTLQNDLKLKNDENETLRATNLKLFQQVTIPDNNNNTDNSSKNNQKPLSETDIIDGLFDEKGYIK